MVRSRELNGKPVAEGRHPDYPAWCRRPLLGRLARSRAGRVGWTGAADIPVPEVGHVVEDSEVRAGEGESFGLYPAHDLHVLDII